MTTRKLEAKRPGVQASSIATCCVTLGEPHNLSGHQAPQWGNEGIGPAEVATPVPRGQGTMQWLRCVSGYVPLGIREGAWGPGGNANPMLPSL